MSDRERQEIKADIRKNKGTSASRALRRDGKIPASLYGEGESALALSFDGRMLSRIAHTEGFMTSLLSIDIDGKKVRAIPRETQVHPINGALMHVDFLLLGANARIDVEVNVSFINEELSPGLKRGGVLNIVRHEVELSCPAESIPDELIANLEGLEIGDGIHISSIALPEGVNATITDRDFTIATIAAPAAVKSEEEEAEEAAVAAEGVEATGEKAAEDAEGTKDAKEGGE